MSDTPIAIVRTVEALRERIRAWRAAGETVGLVPTMGALHEGHLSLVRLAGRHARRTVTSIFVNPTQFAPTEDFRDYPRQEARDADLLASVSCDLLFAPSAEAMYPRGFSTTVTVAGVSAPLEGERRPTHFAGVATVVTKLLMQTTPDVAVFGEKDFQQLQVIRRMTRDLDLPVQIIGGPTARDEHGLALSSRNAYLSPDQRVVARRLNQILRQAVADIAADADWRAAEASAAQSLKDAGFTAVDYVEVRLAEDLTRPGDGPLPAGGARILAAAWLGKTRLIDNMAV